MINNNHKLHCFLLFLHCKVSRANGEGSNPYLVGIDGSIERIHSLLTDAKRVAGKFTYKTHLLQSSLSTDSKIVAGN